MPIHIELVTQEQKIFDEPDADIVIVPAVEGEMGVLPNHAPVLTTLTYGELVVRKGGAEEALCDLWRCRGCAARQGCCFGRYGGIVICA